MERFWILQIDIFYPSISKTHTSNSKIHCNYCANASKSGHAPENAAADHIPIYKITSHTLVSRYIVSERTESVLLSP